MVAAAVMLFVVIAISCGVRAAVASIIIAAVAVDVVFAAVAL